MRRASPLHLLAGVVLAVGIALFFILRSPGRPADPLAPLADSIRDLRAAVDSCRARLDDAAVQLTTFDQRLDSMRARVRDLETIDPRGVPTDSYAAYLDAFDGYNDSVPAWTARADTLRARWSDCRDLTTLHNTLADSLRRALEQQLERMRTRER